MTQIVSAAEVGDPLNLVAGDVGYTLLSSVCDYVTDLVERVCKVKIGSTSYRHRVDASGDPALDLESPVSEISLVTDEFYNVLKVYHPTDDSARVSVNSTTMTFATNSGSSTLTLASYATVTLLVAAAPSPWVVSIEFADEASSSPLQLIECSGLPASASNFSYIGIASRLGAVQCEIREGSVYRYDGLDWEGDYWAWYTAGYSTVPNALKMIAAEIAREIWTRAQRDTGVITETTAGGFKWDQFDRVFADDPRLSAFKVLRICH